MSTKRYSPVLRSTDLNDFLAPATACVVAQSKPTPPLYSRNEVKIGPPVESKPVKISLKDCLACSGCVTSAEAVMLEKQNFEEFLSNINTGKSVIVSISPQSRASFAAHFGLSPVQVFRKLTTFFKSLGVKAVFDTSCSRDLALIEACNEFIARYKQTQSLSGVTCKTALPMISSACPGWICYAEKTLGSYILPYISSVKSPQQTIGAVIKRYLCHKMSLRPDEVYHVTVMPCFDKKLEAARNDFVFEMEYQYGGLINGDLKVTEVDSVLTTGEVLELMQSRSVDFITLDESPLDRMLTNVTDDGHLYGVDGSSGGYAETIFRHAAKTLYGRDIEGPVEFRILRNSDSREVSLEVEGKTVLRFALCYGFRNLQNVVRKIKNGNCDYHFLEIMACPSGCLNGAGQIKPKAGQSGKDLLQNIESVSMSNEPCQTVTGTISMDRREYIIVILTFSLIAMVGQDMSYDKLCEGVQVTEPFQNPIVKELYAEWLEQPGSEKAKRYVHTEYHPVEKSVTSQLQNW